jgi:cytochrome c-type biogenesis protein CcmH
LSPAILAAVVGFVSSIGAAAGLERLKRERPAFAALVLAPIVAAAVYGAVARLASAPGSAPAATAAPAAASARGDGASTASVAPVATVAMARNGAGVGLEAWHKEAEELRGARRFAAARDVYAKIVKATPDDADAWADLADSSAAAVGGDLNAGADAINHALLVDPKHPKALWLKASLEMQEQRYPNAIELWQRLLASLPSDSNDARIVRANLDETRTLAARQGAGR